MSEAIEFYFDFGSPTSYLAYKRLHQIQDQFDVEIDFRPVLLGAIFKATQNRSPVTVPAKAKWMMDDMQRYADRYGVEFHNNPFFPLNTLGLMRAAVAANQLNLLEQFIDVVFDAVWVRRLNAADVEVLESVLIEKGINASEVFSLAQQDAVKAELKDRTNLAIEAGLFGCPTMLFRGEFFFGQDRIFYIEEMLASGAK